MTKGRMYEELRYKENASRAELARLVRQVMVLRKRGGGGSRWSDNHIPRSGLWQPSMFPSVCGLSFVFV